MLTLPESVRIYLATAPTDMRKGFDGLSALIEHELGEDVYSGHLFVFVSRRGDRVKILTWERGGFVLWYKRLERGRFRLPRIAPTQKRVTRVSWPCCWKEWITARSDDLGAGDRRPVGQPER